MRLLMAIFVTLLLIGTASANNWPSWRGPDLNGVAPGKNYPVRWSRTENVLWKSPLPSHGSSTPVVWEDRIFITSPGGGKNLVLCFDRNGKKLWETALGKNRPRSSKKQASGSNSSPVTDGKYVFVYYKSGDFAGLDFAGNVLWQKNLQEMYGEDTLWWDLGTSPVLTKNHVVVTCMHSGPSYLAAFDKQSGKLVWKHDRNLDAPKEAAQSYTTPVVATHEGREIIVILGADHVTAHDAASGKELWRVGGLNPTQNGYFRSIASPVISGDTVVAPYARGNSLTAIRMGGKGDVTKSHVLWSNYKERSFTDVPTPVAADGKVYVCHDKGRFTCLDLKTGETLWEIPRLRFHGQFYSSPILADGKIYVTADSGETLVLDAHNEGKLLATNDLGEMAVATPVFVDGHILLRTDRHLYCIGK